MARSRQWVPPATGPHVSRFARRVPGERVLLEGFFEHPAGYSDWVRDLQAIERYRVSKFFNSLLACDPRPDNTRD